MRRSIKDFVSSYIVVSQLLSFSEYDSSCLYSVDKVSVVKAQVDSPRYRTQRTMKTVPPNESTYVLQLQKRRFKIEGKSLHKDRI